MSSEREAKGLAGAVEGVTKGVVGPLYQGVVHPLAAEAGVGRQGYKSRARASGPAHLGIRTDHRLDSAAP